MKSSYKIALVAAALLLGAAIFYHVSTRSADPRPIADASAAPPPASTLTGPSTASASTPQAAAPARDEQAALNDLLAKVKAHTNIVLQDKPASETTPTTASAATPTSDTTAADSTPSGTSNALPVLRIGTPLSRTTDQPVTPTSTTEPSSAAPASPVAPTAASTPAPSAVAMPTPPPVAVDHAASASASTHAAAPAAATSPLPPTAPVEADVTAAIAPPPPAAAAAIRPARPTTYTIKAGDTFSSIAQELLGSENKWVELAQANPLVDPARLKVGQEIRLPGEPPAAAPAAAAAAPAARETRPAPASDSVAAGVSYTVAAGDTLSSIAKQFYNSPGAWRTVYDANKDAIGPNPDRLRAGMTLTIPPATKPAR